MRLLRKIYQLLTPQERRRSLIVVLAVILMGFAEMVGVASIVPFLTVLADPDALQSQPYLMWAYSVSGLESTRQFLVLLGLAVVSLFIASIVFKALGNYVIIRFTAMRRFSLSSRLVNGYLNQPYEWFLNRHSSELGKTILSEVDQAVGSGLLPLWNLVAAFVGAAFLLALLVVVSPWLAFYLALLLGGAYLVIYACLRPMVRRLSEEHFNQTRLKFKIVSEAFGGIKEIKVSGLERTFCDRYQEPAKRSSRVEAAVQLVSQTPRFLLEGVAFGSMLAVSLYLFQTPQGLAGALPTLGLYALAGYRLLPTLQQIYLSFTQLRYTEVVVNNLHAELQLLQELPGPCEGQEQSIHLSKAISLENVSYRYPNASSPTLSELNIEIPVKQTIGLVGSTGSGKTTCVDIILGLLQPSHGSLCIDGIPLSPSHLRGWQKVIGYVPQTIYLSDDTLAANIAFGIPPNEIDMNLVQAAAKIANLHDFVVSDLPEQYQTKIGERGVRLSGGQRQRIGIARAFYHRPQVMVLDEATSALDNQTEVAVMDAVANVGSQITLIIIAHRLSTVQGCDKIYMLDRGRVVGSGSYSELINSSPQFRELAQAAERGSAGISN